MRIYEKKVEIFSARHVPFKGQLFLIWKYCSIFPAIFRLTQRTFLQNYTLFHFKRIWFLHLFSYKPSKVIFFFFLILEILRVFFFFWAFVCCFRSSGPSRFLYYYFLYNFLHRHWFYRVLLFTSVLTSVLCNLLL